MEGGDRNKRREILRRLPSKAFCADLRRSYFSLHTRGACPPVFVAGQTDSSPLWKSGSPILSTYYVVPWQREIANVGPNAIPSALSIQPKREESVRIKHVKRALPECSTLEHNRSRSA